MKSRVPCWRITRTGIIIRSVAIARLATSLRRLPVFSNRWSREMVRRAALADKFPNVAVHLRWLLMNHPVRTFWNALDRQLWNELIQSIEIAREQGRVLFTP